jgi:hypothetical protein
MPNLPSSAATREFDRVFIDGRWEKYILISPALAA